MDKSDLKELVKHSIGLHSTLDKVWSVNMGAAESGILGTLLEYREELESNLDLFNEEELKFLSYFTINDEKKNSREKAVKILKQHGVECEYVKEKDDIQIWNNSSDKINIYYLAKNVVDQTNKKLSINISSSNQDFENQKKFYLEFDNIIYALEKIKKIDPDLVK